MSALADEITAALAPLHAEIRALREELRQPRQDGECLVDVAEAARRLGLSISTVYKRSESCALPSVKDGGRVLFKIADLVQYAEERRRSPERVRKMAGPA